MAATGGQCRRIARAGEYCRQHAVMMRGESTAIVKSARAELEEKILDKVDLSTVEGMRSALEYAVSETVRGAMDPVTCAAISNAVRVAQKLPQASARSRPVVRFETVSTRDRAEELMRMSAIDVEFDEVVT